MDTTFAQPIHTLVVGVFDDTNHARQAITELEMAGIPGDQIGCVCGGFRPHVAATNDMSPDAGGEWLEDEVRSGHTVVIIHDADERAEEVRELLRKDGGTIREPSPVGTYGTGLPSTPY